MARIAVIGAGMGAMAAAARLAVAGNRVTVLERTDTYGGAVRRYARDGFAFDTGPGLLRLPAVYRDLFLKTGREPLESCVETVRVDPAARHVFPDGTVLTLPNAARGTVRAALDEALGAGAGERWTELLNRARDAWETTRRPLLEEPLRDAPGSRTGPAHDTGYPALRGKGLLRLRRALRTGGASGPTLAEIAADELRDPRLAALLESYARVWGLDPAVTPAGAAVLPYLEDSFGTWYVRGGVRTLANALYERCRARRVEFRFGAAAAGVREKDGAAAGVELADGSLVDADTVVLGSGPGLRPGRNEWPSGSARLTVLLALRGARPEGTPHRTLVHNVRAPGLPGPAGGPPLTVLRPDDPALRPDGAHESAVLTVPVPVGAVGDRAAGERIADGLLAAADAAGLGLGARVLWREVRTPRDDERETGAPGGQVPPPALAGGGGALLQPPNQTALRGLYAVGGWAHPGGGLAHAGMSGALATGLIVEGPDWRGSA
ncbi:phytoene desaturase family protein [Streptomyces boncukensis]|uniref:NAD(P)/FAD-dependent oxidoreductase n=1 Tax=Streptomyces boncukensis TaxID=2711219 RepID=A0A6G4X5T6_9ACTN|nr:NAD(P)/FAD-dependent oxidoreductase [Streptomyces boncukensis]NGO72230.1 NAD(P)/FAD-dependent oxidoreductase [Streptomyces boncukensis]